MPCMLYVWQTEASLAEAREALQKSRTESTLLREEVEACGVREAGMRALLMQKDQELETMR